MSMTDDVVLERGLDPVLVGKLMDIFGCVGIYELCQIFDIGTNDFKKYFSREHGNDLYNYPKKFIQYLIYFNLKPVSVVDSKKNVEYIDLSINTEMIDTYIDPKMRNVELIRKIDITPFLPPSVQDDEDDVPVIQTNVVFPEPRVTPSVEPMKETGIEFIKEGNEIPAPYTIKLKSEGDTPPQDDLEALAAKWAAQLEDDYCPEDHLDEVPPDVRDRVEQGNREEEQPSILSQENQNIFGDFKTDQVSEEVKERIEETPIPFEFGRTKEKSNAEAIKSVDDAFSLTKEPQIPAPTLPFEYTNLITKRDLDRHFDRIDAELQNTINSINRRLEAFEEYLRASEITIQSKDTLNRELLHHYTTRDLIAEIARRMPHGAGMFVPFDPKQAQKDD